MGIHNLSPSKYLKLGTGSNKKAFPILIGKAFGNISRFLVTPSSIYLVQIDLSLADYEAFTLLVVFCDKWSIVCLVVSSPYDQKGALRGIH